jgi:hypothetical protein
MPKAAVSSIKNGRNAAPLNIGVLEMSVLCWALLPNLRSAQLIGSAE